MKTAYETFGKKWTYWHPLDSYDLIRRIETWQAYQFTRLMAAVRRDKKRGKSNGK